MHPDLIQSHAEHHLTSLRKPRAAIAKGAPLDRIRHAVARALRAQAMRIASPAAPSAPRTW